MEPLDLTKAPPRSPREELDGLPALPRTIDKMRAHLPGGNPGVYNIKGLSSTMFETIGITEDQFRDAVATAQSDQDVVDWLRTHAKTGEYSTWAGKANALKVADVKAQNPERFAERYPISNTRTDIEYMSDMLAVDDEDMFAKR